MQSFKKLTFEYDIQLLKNDLVKATTAWTPHFNQNGYHGDWSGIALREAKETNHSLASNSSVDSYTDSEILKSCKYFMHILDGFKCKKSTVRLLKLGPGASIKPHKDPDLSFFYGLVRLHIPIVTNEKVKFEIDGEKAHMKAGECWFGEFCLNHSVVNDGLTDRIHLVIDCEVNSWMRNLFEKEGILKPGEQALNQIDKLSDIEKKQMTLSLKALGTPTAQEIINKINSSSSHENSN